MNNFLRKWSAKWPNIYIPYVWNVNVKTVHFYF